MVALFNKMIHLLDRITKPVDNSSSDVEYAENETIPEEKEEDKPCRCCCYKRGFEDAKEMALDVVTKAPVEALSYDEEQILYDVKNAIKKLSADEKFISGVNVVALLSDSTSSY